MKKTFYLLVCLCIFTGVIAQEAADKKVQAGIMLGAGMNFQKMGTKNIDKNGIGADLTIGANVNFAFNENIGLSTGAEFDFNSIKYKSATESPLYYNYNDTEIRKQEDVTSGDALFQVDERKQSQIYLTIPTMLIFRTKFIGYFRYFGKFGLRNSFLLSSKSADTGFDYETGNLLDGGVQATNKNMKSPGDVFFFKTAVGIAGGAEWNFTGSTSLMAEIGFYYGVTPLHFTTNEENMTLFTSGVNNGSGNDIYIANKATQSQLMFKVAILF
ncbi:MAG: outer membrane beta-barrel protein [Bacteroidota bacterium]